MKSVKEMAVEQKLVQLTKELIELTPEKDGLPLKTVEMLINDEEVQAVQDYANNVSIVRLGLTTTALYTCVLSAEMPLKCLKSFTPAA